MLYALCRMLGTVFASTRQRDIREARSAPPRARFLHNAMLLELLIALAPTVCMGGTAGASWIDARSMAAEGSLRRSIVRDPAEVIPVRCRGEMVCLKRSC